jgi:hypothetical protein
MKIFIFSGSGIGAGKTKAAKTMTQDVWSFANAIRQDLTYKYPAYNWYNKTQEYKDHTIVEEYSKRNATVRQVMLEEGQRACNGDPAYWAKRMVEYLKGRYFIADGVSILGIDDCRKMCELETIRAAFPGQVTHFHIDNPWATVEPEFENEQLAQVADYVLSWEKK